MSKKGVSFSASTSPASTPKPTTSSGGPTKSALRPASSSSSDKITDRVPASLYTHYDPLIRRLRLNSAHGEPVDLQSEFRDTSVVAFLFGSEWSGRGTGRLAEYYESISKFTKRNPHRFKCVYVSIDTDYEAFKRCTEGKPWLSMEWADGSNLPFAEHEDIDSTPLETARDEDYLLAEDEDLSSPTLPPSTYTRPYSRVHLAAKFQVLTVPTFLVYYLPKPLTETGEVNQEKGRVLNYGVRHELLSPERIEESYAKWSLGKSADLGFSDIVRQMRWQILFLSFFLIYTASVRIGGDEYNWVARLIEKYLGSGGSPITPSDLVTEQTLHKEL